jgi:hypothetical protein
MTRPFLLACVATLGFAGLPGCDGCGCGGPTPIAELETKKREVARDHADRQGDWQPADIESTFDVGDGARTGSGASAVFRLRGNGKLRLGEQTQIRFRDAPPGEKGSGIDVLAGEAIVEAPADGKVRLHTQFGLAVLDQGSRVRLAARDDGTSFEVLMGEARVDRATDSRRLASGESLHINLRGAIIEREAADASDPRPPSTAADAGAPDGASDGATDEAADAEEEITAEVRGRGARAKGPDDDRWRPLAPGSTVLAPGTELRVARRGKVRLARGTQRARLEGPGQFVVGDGPALVRDVAGQVFAEADSDDLIVHVPGGHIRVRGGEEAGSAGEVEVSDRGTAVKATRGRVDVRVGKRELTLRAGEDVALGEESIEIGGRGPERVHFTVPAGENFAIRVPDLPVAVGFVFGDACPEEAILELLRGGRVKASDRGTRQGNLLIPAGAFRYRVRCIEKGRPGRRAVASGRVRAVRDSGTARLPPTASQNLIDLDGRRYTLMYQNRLPSVQLRWREAPSGGRYVLAIDSRPGGSRRLELGSPSHLFESGQLHEGQHVLQMIGPAGQRSPETTVVIRFDNAAATASVRVPDDRGFAAGETVQVSGVALEGWRVSAGGHDLPLDGANRFAGEVPVPAGQDGIAIRLSHRAKGIQYYVRRSRTP